MKTTRFCLTLALLASLPLMACKKEETKAEAPVAAQVAVPPPAASQMIAPVPERTAAAAVAAPGDAAAEEAPVRDSPYITVDESQDWLVDRDMVTQIQSSRTPEELKAAQDEIMRRMQAMAEGNVPFRSAGGEVGVDPEDWVGRWNSAEEGRYMELSLNKDTTFTVTLVGKDSQHSSKGGFIQDQIIFEGPGQTDIIRSASGDETGVPAFAGKFDCVIISKRDAYCRD